MALITSAASGNFNAGATWTGGVVPGVGDEARASNGHTVTITANATCDEVSNAGTGIFTLNSGVTLTANVTNKSATLNRTCLQFTAASPAQASIVGSCTGGPSNDAVAVANTSTGTLAITGNVTGVTARAYGANNAGSGIINVTGNATGGGGTINPYGINNNSSGTISVTGDVTGGAAATGAGIGNASSGSISVVGQISANVGNGIFNAAAGNITSVGNVIATNSANAISSTNTSATITLSGSLISGSNGTLAVFASKCLMNPTPSTATVRFAKNGINTYSDFFTADNALGQANPTDVRSGTIYADGNLTGTCAVPAPSSVSAGVPIDATVGTAILTGADVATAVWSAATRTVTGGTVDTLTNAPTSVTPSDIWSHATRTLTSASGPTAVQIRQEMDSNSTKLANLDATISSRLAASSYTAPTTAAEIATAVEGSLLNEGDGQAVLNAIVGAIGNSNVDEIALVAAIRSDLERNGGKLDSIPTTAAPSASAVASATRTELSTELSRIDQNISSRLASASYVAPTVPPTAAANAAAVRTELGSSLADITAIKSVTDDLDPITERLANCATTNIVGTLLAQSQS